MSDLRPDEPAVAHRDLEGPGRTKPALLLTRGVLGPDLAGCEARAADETRALSGGARARAGARGTTKIGKRAQTDRKLTKILWPPLKAPTSRRQ